MEICSGCAMICHKGHEGLEYDSIENGYCDCGHERSGCKIYKEEIVE